MLDKKNYVEVYIWEKTDKMDKGHVSLQLFIDGEADPDNYLSFFPLKDLDKEEHIKITMMEEKVLTRVYDGCFFYPCADNYYYDRSAIGIYARKNCKIRRVYGLDIHNMAKKIRDLKSQSLIFRLISGSAILKFENHRNCAGTISEVLHAGGIRRFFIIDEIMRTCVSNITAFFPLAIALYLFDTKSMSPPSFLDSLQLCAYISSTTIFPASIISKVYSHYFNFSEADCFLLQISLSSMFLEFVLLHREPIEHFIRLFSSIFTTTGIIKYFPFLFHLTPISNISSVALGNLIGRIINAYITEKYFTKHGQYVPDFSGIIGFMLGIMLTMLVGAAQLLPDGIAYAIKFILSRYNKYLPAGVSRILSNFCDQLTCFAWLIERPYDISTLLYRVEKLESENNLSSSSLTQYQTGFFSRSVENISLYIRSFFNGR